jgi:hypothetical protein
MSKLKLPGMAGYYAAARSNATAFPGLAAGWIWPGQNGFLTTKEAIRRRTPQSRKLLYASWEAIQNQD